jgi:hypothetical protein
MGNHGGESYQTGPRPAGITKSGAFISKFRVFPIVGDPLGPFALTDFRPHSICGCRFYFDVRPTRMRLG